MQFGPFFMYIVENRGIKNSEAMEFVLLKWSITIFWFIIWGKQLDSGTVSLFALTSDLTNSETVAATL